MAGAVQLRIRRGAPRARHLSEPAWLRWLLIAVVLAFLVLFLVLPLALVFTEAFSQWVGRLRCGDPEPRRDRGARS